MHTMHGMRTVHRAPRVWSLSRDGNAESDEYGGQTWTSEANAQVTASVFWTRFNGIWTGNPSVTNTTGTEALTVYSFAVATTPDMHPEIDVPLTFASHSGGTVTVPSFTTNTAGTLALVGFVSDENNTWSAPTAG